MNTLYDPILNKLRSGKACIENGDIPAAVADPAVEFPVIDPAWGDCRYLDSTFRQLSFRGRVKNLRRVTLETVSSNAAADGSIVLVPVVNGVELDSSFVCAVRPFPYDTEFELDVPSGTLALRRAVEDERDTLKNSDGTAETAVVLNLILWIQS